MSLFLKPVELLYRAINRLWRQLYRSGLLRQKRLPRPVVSIGNRSIGGAGKTPAVIALAEELVKRGFRPAILTRGYKRDAADTFALVDSADSRRFGDEPVVMANALPSVPVVVGSDRHAAGLWFLERGDCDLFLLDDGFQHLRLARDCDIVIESERSRWYREGVSAMRDADFVLTRASGGSIRLVPAAVLRGGERRPVEELRGEKVVAFSALADNEQFFTLLETLGCEVIERVGRPDHHRWSDDEVSEILQRAGQVGAIPLTTAKDAVKITRDVAVLEVAMQFDDTARLVGDILRRCRLTERR